MPYITTAERIGMEKGIKQGIEQELHQGLKQGLLEAIELGLKLKFGIASSRDMGSNVSSVSEVMRNRIWAKHSGTR